MKEIYNEEQLEEYINQIIKETIEEVSLKVEDLLRKHINTDTYRINKTAGKLPNINDWYLDGTGTPSYEFRDIAWNNRKFKDALGAYAYSLFYDGLKMSPPSSEHKTLHGSYLNNDARTELARLLNISGESLRGHKKREPYWDNFISDLSKKLGSWLYVAFKKRGMIITELKDFVFVL